MMSFSRNKAFSFGRGYFYLIMLLTFSGVMAWQLSCPLTNDDYAYSLAPAGGEYRGDQFWRLYGEEYKTAGEVWIGIKGHFLENSSRLSNLLYIVVQLLPLKVVKAVCGLSVFAMFFGLFRISVSRRREGQAWLLVVFTLLFWYVFPWWDSMQAGVFVFNYPMACALCVLFLWLYRRILNFRTGQYVLFCLYSLFLGCYHEGFAIAMGTYVFLDALLRRDSWRRWVVWAIFVAAVVSILFTGTYVRMEADAGGLSLIERLSISMSMIPFKTIFCAIALVLSSVTGIVCFRRGRWAELHKLIVVCGVMVGQFVMCTLLNIYARAMWGADMFAVIAILLSLQCLVGEGAIRGLFWKGLLMAFAGLYCFWLVELVVWQRRTLALNNALVVQLSPRYSYQFNVLYGPEVHKDWVPSYLLDIPSPMFEVSSSQVDAFSWYWISPMNRGLAILPERYVGLPIDSLPEFGGNAGVRGVWPYILFEKPYEGFLKVEGGKHGAAANPVMRILSSLSSEYGDKDSELTCLWVQTEAVRAPDSTEWHLAQIYYVPRTFRYRPILRVDTLERR